MRSGSSTSFFVALVGAGLVAVACGSSSGPARTDAGTSRDVPMLSGGASGTGGGPALGGATGMGGGSALGGRAGTGSATGTGGSPGTGGAASTGGSSGAAGGVLLTASYDEQSVHATWQNHTEQSIFLAGCGTVQWSRFDGTTWSDGAPFMVCSWEGIAVEVAAGATFTENDSGPPGGAGRYRLSGRYGVGCTPGVGLTAAGCTAFATVTSNEFVVARTRTDTGGAGGTGGSGAGGMVGGSTGTTATGGAGGRTSSGTGGAATVDAGQAASYSGCRYIGGIDRAVVGKFDPQAGTCAVLVLAQTNYADASMGLTLSANWGVEDTALWRSTTPDCAARTTAKGAVAATSAVGSATVNYSATPTLDIDAVLSFPAGDAGPAQSVELKAQGVDINHGC